MSTLAEKVAVMQAHGEGKAIQFKDIVHGPAVWNDVGRPAWNWAQNEYRVKTERTSPRAFRIGFDSGGSTTGLQYHDGRPMRVSSRPTCESSLFVEKIDE